MRYIKMERAEQGMILGRTLLSASGRVLLRAGAELKPAYIERIRRHGFSGIYIDDEFSREIVIKDAVPESLRQNMVKDVKKIFTGMENQKLKAVSRQKEGLMKSVYEIIDSIMELKGTIPNISDLKTHDEYTFQHSVSVAIISIVLGIEMERERDWLFELGMAALFHDIGKTKIPLSILNKPGRLTDSEFDEIRKHPRFGYEYIKQKLDLPGVVYVSVLEHHEKYGGGGYPVGAAGDGILEQARIIAVADVYDAVTSVRPYSRPMEPADAYNLIVSGSATHFDPAVIEVFARAIAPFPAGTLVYLSNGWLGVVAENYRDCILRPLIKLLPGFGPPDASEYADLKNDPALRSVTVLGLA